MTSGSVRLTLERHIRLALVRVLLERGRDEVNDQPPISALGLLPLHDAVEMFLRVAAEALGAKLTERPRFLDYFKLIDEKLPTGTALAERGTMDRLNEARVGLKHRGLLPDHSELAGHRDAVDRFFAANVPLVFGHELAAISLTVLVRDPDLRRELEESEGHLAGGRFADALTAAATAVARSLVRAGVPAPGDFRPPPLTWGPQAQVAKEIGELWSAITAQAVGIDLAAYRAFRAITPIVVFTMDGKAHDTWVAGVSPERGQTEAAVRFGTELVLRVEDWLVGVDRTYEHFGLVRRGKHLLPRRPAAAGDASRAAYPPTAPSG